MAGGGSGSGSGGGNSSGSKSSSSGGSGRQQRCWRRWQRQRHVGGRGSSSGDVGGGGRGSGGSSHHSFIPNPLFPNTGESVQMKKNTEKFYFYLRHNKSNQANLDRVISESRSGTITHKNQKKLRQAANTSLKAEICTPVSQQYMVPRVCRKWGIPFSLVEARTVIRILYFGRIRRGELWYCRVCSQPA